jgi:hypothetical protein
MESGRKPAEFYTRKLDETAQLRIAAVGKRSALAWLRAGTVLLTFGSGYMAWEHQDLWWLIGVIAGLASFGRAVVVDVNNSARIRRLEGLATLLTQESDFLTQGKPIPDNGGDYIGKEDHPYAYDLDIFGKGSVFGMLNRCHSGPGRELLEGWLLAPADRKTILERQEAARELASDPDGLFDLAALTRETPLRKQTVTRIEKWLAEEEAPFKASYWGIVRLGYPILTLGLLAFYIAGMVNSSVFGLCLVVFIAISLLFSKQVIGHYMALSGIVKEVSILSEGVALVEKRSFETTLNQRLQKPLLSQGKA